MTALKDIAQDSRKALTDLEKRLGAEPGALLRDMESLAPPGQDWSKHLPYRVAASYYDDERARGAYEAHVDKCEYCKTLLESLHPTALDAANFSSRAKHVHITTARNWSAKAAPYSLAASVIFCALGAWSMLGSQPWSLRPPSYTAALPAVRGWVTDVKIGSGTDIESSQMNGQDEASFPAGKPVKLVAEIRGAPNRTPISVIWVGPNNQEVRRETNWTREGEESVAFSALDTTAWKTGDYRAELWVADNKVKQEPFEITPATSTLPDQVP